MNNMKKDCIDCKHSYFEDLDNILCCDLTNKTLNGILSEDVEGIPCCYGYIYPSICDKFEEIEVSNMEETITVEDLAKEYDIKPYEIREAIIFYKVKHDDNTKLIKTLKQRIEYLKKEKEYYKKNHYYDSDFYVNAWRSGQSSGKIDVLKNEIEFLEKLVGGK